MNIRDFLDFVDAIKNLEQYEKQVQTLKDENERLEKNIEATAKVNDLSALLEKASKDSEAAAKTLAEAKAEAAVLKEQAKKAFEKKEAALVIRETEVSDKQEHVSKMLEEVAKIKADTENRLAKELADVLARKEQLILDNQEVSDRLAKLKAVMG